MHIPHLQLQQHQHLQRQLQKVFHMPETGPQEHCLPDFDGSGQVAGIVVLGGATEGGGKCRSVKAVAST